MRYTLPLPLCLALVAILGCDDRDDDQANTSTPTVTTEAALTYYGDAKAILDTRCATCHRAGDIGPFPLTTFEEVKAFEAPVRASIVNGTMPPWQPDDACNTYLDNIDLSADEKETLLGWLDAGAPEGDPATAPPSAEPPQPFATDIVVRPAEAYAPRLEPDDYRCQLIPWPAQETRYVTGLRVIPDKRAIVHHVIVFVATPDQVEQYQAYDDAEEGPGYTCYGGPTANTGESGFGDIDPAALLAALNKMGLTIADVQGGNLTGMQMASLMSELGLSGAGGFASLGSWVPGVPATPYPAGTGIKVEPGSMLVVQFHYNTLSSDPVADRSTIEFATTTEVEREATNLGVVDIGWVSNGRLGGEAMTIPAGEAEVEHATLLSYDNMLLARARQTLGLPEGAPLVLYSGNHHMHELGRTQRTEIRHEDGSNTCVLDIPDWDFNWQGSYKLTEPITIRPGDSIWMGCSWDNSEANQPIIDGQVRQPLDISWGEGTTDEMCLGGFYVTGE